MSNEYVKPQQEYKNVDFEFHRVNLLWNCCAIVKKLLTLQAEVDELEHKVNNIPDDIDATFAEQATQLRTLNAAVATLREEMDDVLTALDDDEADIESIRGTVTSLDHDVTTLQGLVATLNSNYASLNSRVSANETAIANTESTVSNQGTRLSTAETKISQLQTATTTATNDVNALKSSTNVASTVFSSCVHPDTSIGSITLTFTDMSAIKTEFGMRIMLTLTARLTSGTSSGYTQGGVIGTIDGELASMMYDNGMNDYVRFEGVPKYGNHNNSHNFAAGAIRNNSTGVYTLYTGTPIQLNSNNNPSFTTYMLANILLKP